MGFADDEDPSEVKFFGELGNCFRPVRNEYDCNGNSL